MYRLQPNLVIRAPLLLLAGAFFWGSYVVWGENLIRAIYDGTTFSELLNGLIKRQSINPVDYYLQKGAVAARGVAILFWSAAAILGFSSTSLVKRWLTEWPKPLPIAVFATLLFWEAHFLEVPLFQLLPHWFWSIYPRSLNNLWVLVVMFAGLFLAAHLVLKAPDRSIRNLGILVLLGCLIQYGFAAMDGSVIEALRQRLLSTGHGAFPRVAVHQTGLLQVISGYDANLDSGQLAHYPFATKPPGALLFFSVVWQLTELLPLAGNTLDRMTTMASMLFPVVTYLVLIPMLLLAKHCGQQSVPWVACLIYVTLPNVTLINMHLDQFLLPQMGLWFAVSAFTAQRTGSLFAGIFSGLLLYLCLFLSFSLIALVAVIPMAYVTARAGHHKPLRPLTGLVIGFAAAYLLFGAATGYHATERLLAAVSTHSHWKVEGWDMGTTFYSLLLNMLDFAVWCGIPVCLFCVVELRHAVKQLWHRRWLSIDRELISTALLGISGALLLFGRTLGETGRLWLFLTPLVAISVALSLVRLAPERLVPNTRVILALQMFSTLTLKKYQDFFPYDVGSVHHFPASQ